MKKTKKPAPASPLKLTRKLIREIADTHLDDVRGGSPCRSHVPTRNQRASVD